MRSVMENFILITDPQICIKLVIFIYRGQVFLNLAEWNPLPEDSSIESGKIYEYM